jgi:hypothetical protein
LARADGGVFQSNHLAGELGFQLAPDCADVSGLHWKYGFNVAPDTIEVWNISHLLQPPLPAEL